MMLKAVAGGAAVALSRTQVRPGVVPGTTPGGPEFEANSCGVANPVGSITGLPIG